MRASTKVMWVSVTWIVTVAIASRAILASRYMTLTLKGPPPQVRVDTVRSVVYDTVIVISRAKDTVRIIERTVGPLTEQRLARLICGPLSGIYGDERDHFNANTLGMIVCPRNGLTHQ